MGKIRKYKLSWKPSESSLIVGYKLYMSKTGEVSYDSNFIRLGNVHEVHLPDILHNIPKDGESIFFGVTAVDEAGNESDMLSLAEPYQVTLPPAPLDFAIIALEDFSITHPQIKVEIQPQSQLEPDTPKALYTRRPIQDGPQIKTISTEGKILDNFDPKIQKLASGQGDD